jgi:beta-glucosidase
MHPYQDPARSNQERIEDLLGRMSWKEKVLQLSARHWGRTPSENWADIEESEMRELLADGIGQICQLGKRRTRPEIARLANRVQRVLRDHTRLGIPALIHEETLHGMIAREVTSLPEPLHLASTWNPELVERSFEVVAAQMRSAGLHLGLSPVLDLGRDPRWGRFGETYGEDPHLVSRMGVSAVRGLQGRPHGKIQPDRILATGKHFVGYGQSEGGHNVGPFAAGWNELVQAHMAPWRAAVTEAKLGCVMPSYAAVEGEPVHASRHLLTDVLRERIGFDGLVVSDYGGVNELHDLHRVTDSPEASARLAILAGMDCELPSGTCYETHLERLAKADPAVAEAVDVSVGRVLEAKFRLGLFEDPFVDESICLPVTEEADALALQVAAEGIVLLKNDAGRLPLDTAGLSKVAVIGPHVDENMLGPYHATPRENPSYLDALGEAFGPGVTIHHEPGCRITGPAIRPDGEANLQDPGKDHSIARLSTAADDAEAIDRAVAAAERSDLVLLFVGDSFQTTKESFRAKPHGDRADIGLLGGQRALLRALRAAGTPIVVILLHMGAVADFELFSGAETILDAGCGGQAAAQAVANVLLGRTEPGGRLAWTVPLSAEYVPVFSGAPAAARRGYGFCETSVAFPLGFGLSYTRWQLSDVQADRTEMALGEDVRFTCRIANIGDRAGSEVIQIYHRDCVASRTRPDRELAAFVKVSLAAGESQERELIVPAERLGWYNADCRWQQEPGIHEFWITTGADPLGGQKLSVTVS